MKMRTVYVKINTYIKFGVEINRKSQHLNSDNYVRTSN